MAYAEPEGLSEQQVATANDDLLTPAGQRRRQEAAVALRISGATYTQIADRLEYGSASDARRAVEAALARSVGEDDVKQLRFLTARRLERLMRAVWPKATDPDDPEQLAAVRTGIAIVDRHARLYGVDAPQQMVVYSPSAGMIEDWLVQARKQLTGHLPPEGDVIEGEVDDG
jgi:hypothetical protein